MKDALLPLEAFFEQIYGLGSALGPVLIQLPPSLKFETPLAGGFLGNFRRLFAGEAVIEPRHSTWFDSDAEALLRAHRIGRVAADPARAPKAAIPSDWTGSRYWRLHGSPRMYFTPYGEERLLGFVDALTPRDWCIFDNTASGAALDDALLLQRLVRSRQLPSTTSKA